MKLNFFLRSAARPVGFAIMILLAGAQNGWQRAILADGLQAGTQSSVLSISGEVEKPLSLTAAQIAKLPHRTVTAKEHDGKEHRFDGTALVEVLRLAGVPLGDKLRGKSLALYVVVRATDGYQVVLALAELDPDFTDNVVLLADQKDGAPLSAGEGPLRIVIPGEKRQARWVRQVVSLSVVRAS
jgi:DMSO/TMAO reductase YedYZ molybdopterin-dependent catalytic subunit